MRRTSCRNSTKGASIRQSKRIDVVAAAGVIAAVSFIAPASVRAATLVVNPGQSIQAAVEAAAPGDTIVVLAGSQHNAIIHNEVTDNRGSTIFSGGIVLVETPIARLDGSHDASTNNLVLLNRLRGNRPADIVKDHASSPNLIVANR